MRENTDKNVKIIHDYKKQIALLGQKLELQTRSMGNLELQMDSKTDAGRVKSSEIKQLQDMV